MRYILEVGLCLGFSPIKPLLQHGEEDPYQATYPSATLTELFLRFWPLGSRELQLSLSLCRAAYWASEHFLFLVTGLTKK